MDGSLTALAAGIDGKWISEMQVGDADGKRNAVGILNPTPGYPEVVTWGENPLGDNETSELGEVFSATDIEYSRAAACGARL